MRELTKDQLEYAIASLKRVVDARQLNQTQLEHLSSVNQSTISKIFARNSDPSYEVLQKLFRAVGLKVADVLFDHDDHTNDLYGYLATPLTGVVNNAHAEKELLRIVTLIKETARSLSGSPMDLYWPGDHTHPLHNADFSPEQVYLIDRSRASTYDFIVLFCAAPSYGVGQENEIATQAGLPAIRIAPSTISRMMSGSFLNAATITYSGSLDTSIDFDVASLRRSLEDTRQQYFKHRALYKNMNGNAFGDRLRKLIAERAGDYRLFAAELGVNHTYLQALMEEQFNVTNPSARLLKRMATRLGTSVAYLLGEAEDSDPIWLQSNAAWRSWVDKTPEVNASQALAMRDEWRHEFHLNRSEVSTVSYRKSNKALSEVDWDSRYQARTKIKALNASSNGGTRGKRGETNGSPRLF